MAQLEQERCHDDMFFVSATLRVAVILDPIFLVPSIVWFTSRYTIASYMKGLHPKSLSYIAENAE